MSTDHGATWVLRQGSRSWRSVAVSGDGTHIVATHEPSALSGSSETVFSADGGRTWVTSGLNFFRASDTTIAADGSRFYTAGNAANITSYSTRTTRGAGGALSGGMYDTIALRYAGGGVFMPIRAIVSGGSAPQ